MTERSPPPCAVTLAISMAWWWPLYWRAFLGAAMTAEFVGVPWCMQALTDHLTAAAKRAARVRVI